MTLLAHLSLDHLDLDLDPGDGPDPTSPTSTGPHFVTANGGLDDEPWHGPWGLMWQWQPADEGIHPLDWLARMYDTGVTYQALMAWVAVFRFDRRPVQIDVFDRHGLPDPDSFDEDDVSLPFRLALTRGPDESERDHLVRLGHQITVWNEPYLRPEHRYRGTIPRYRSLLLPDTHPDAPRTAFPGAATQEVLATSPVTRDRLPLAQRRACPRSVLAILARDPSTEVRRLVVRHRKVNAAILRRFADTGSGSGLDTGYVEPDPVVRQTLLHTDRIRSMLDDTTHARIAAAAVAAGDPPPQKPTVAKWWQAKARGQSPAQTSAA